MIEKLSTLRQITNEGQMGEWRYQHVEDVSFSPQTLIETFLPFLVSAALQHFKESGMQAEATFSHMALFQNIQGSSAIVPVGTNIKIKKRR